MTAKKCRHINPAHGSVVGCWSCIEIIKEMKKGEGALTKEAFDRTYRYLSPKTALAVRPPIPRRKIHALRVFFKLMNDYIYRNCRAPQVIYLPASLEKP